LLATRQNPIEQVLRTFCPTQTLTFSSSTPETYWERLL
jgi:hypothetical protein